MEWEDPDIAVWLYPKDMVFVKNPVLIIWKPQIQIKPVDYIQVENGYIENNWKWWQEFLL